MSSRSLLLPCLGTHGMDKLVTPEWDWYSSRSPRATEPLLVVMGASDPCSSCAPRATPGATGSQCHCPTAAWCWPEANPWLEELQQRGRKQRNIKAPIPSCPAQGFGCRLKAAAVGIHGPFQSKGASLAAEPGIAPALLCLPERRVASQGW